MDFVDATDSLRRESPVRPDEAARPRRPEVADGYGVSIVHMSARVGESVVIWRGGRGKGDHPTSET